MKRGDRSMLILTVALFAVCLLMLGGVFSLRRGTTLPL